MLLHESARQEAGSEARPAQDATLFNFKVRLSELLI
jgi:hypothetical protein